MISGFTSTVTEHVLAVFNSDTSGHYDWTETYTFGSGATWGGPATHTSADSVAVASLNVGATAGGASTCEILSYASAVLEKHVTCVGNYFDATDGVEQVENFNGVWIVSSPAAITSIVLGVGTDDFGVGTVATLYGEQ